MSKLAIRMSFGLLAFGSWTCLAAPPPQRRPATPREPVEVKRRVEPREEEPRIQGGQIKSNPATIRRLIAHPHLAIVRIEGGEGRSTYRMQVGERVVETNDVGQLLDALPPGSEQRLDVSALSAKQRAVFKETARRILDARGTDAVRIVEEAEALVDRSARARNMVIHPAEPNSAGGGYVQAADLTFVNGQRYRISASSSFRATLQHFFERLWTALTSRGPQEDALEITRRVIRETARENNISEDELRVQIHDSLGKSVLVEILVRRLIDAC